MNKITVHDAEFTYACEIGEKMPNSAIIVAETITEKPDWTIGGLTEGSAQRVSVVLALCLSSVTPYATWLRVVRLEDSYKSGAISANPMLRDFCETGHYHRDIETAVREYKLRVAAEMGDHITTGPDR